MAAQSTHAFASTLKTFKTASGKSGKYWSLKELAKKYPSVERLPVSIRIVLESVLRNCDGQKVTAEHVEQLAHWLPNADRTEEVPFVVTRVVLQDFTGVPLLADLAAMRSVAQSLGKSPKAIEPLVPVDLVVDHSVMVDYYGTPKALDLNMKLEFERNNERYQFMKWGMQAFDTFGVVPPGFGIVHQVNLEYFARGVYKSPYDKAETPTYYPDSLVGTDSHTTMINGIGVVGWGVGGIEAEAAMLGQPVYMLTPDVVGFELSGKLREGVTATDLVLYVTAILRGEKVVGKFVEFFGPGAASIAVPDRATIGNMAPEYGATMGFFPVDEMTLAYFRGTGRTDKEIERFEAYYKAQGLFGMPAPGDIDYTKIVKLDLGTVTPSLAGPKRPQDRIDLGHLATKFSELYSKPQEANGFNQPAEKLLQRYPVTSSGTGGEKEVNAPKAGAPRQVVEMEANRSTRAAAHTAAEAPAAPSGISIGNGDVLIAAITSCTNTSNPSVMLAAGLLAKKAVEAGLKVKPHVKTSLAPGSRIVTEYLEKAGLIPYLDKLGFYLAGYGCTTCIGNAGDLAPEINEAITKNDLVAAAVLSGNRNFEARIHPNLKANFLASPPLVVAYAIAGNVMVDLMTQPVGKGKGGKDVYLGDIWPTPKEIDENLRFAMNAKAFRKNYEQIKDNPGKLWSSIKGVKGDVYTWPESTYIAEPPFFDGFKMKPHATDAGFKGARVMALFGDSITTDHISPAGSIKESSPAGIWLKANGVSKADFNSYGSRRGNHEVMMRGTFANVRIKNLMIPPDANGTQEEGGVTRFQPGNEKMFIYDAAQKYMAAGVPTVIFGGEEYGTGSSRDWAAKGTQLLGIKAVIARSFERIHRANLVGMGVLPLQFRGADSWQTLNLTGDEEVDVVIGGELKPQMDVKLVIRRFDGAHQEVTVRLRIDTPIEVDYYKHGGILPFVLRQLLAD
ncbi:aconitate hydratase [Variovorax sp. J22G21]|uniref:aconitate hydratase n=1 Tax=Variovorax fucosicus TaxID=3053517 RepID=UPI002574A219|nr:MULTISPECIES: aconitate hydratase [unclassified Variovorax]MDM0040262.1 aconitate hydratase [Variovorax sp. J22R193]MDM0061635.1 aconitate hydratase [Variovorax sp. J22G21]